ncbi:helix-turn-helix domain-containing protein [Streptomyces sp. NPDC047315]|uniref:helix-turn-helix domain-containing protein n=1 Tax=Streptomyces sp. NPDC047315 TaxID=3155142 RepID=UPI0033C451C2
MASGGADESGGTERLHELLRRVRRQQSDDADPDPRDLVEWLGTELGADVALVDGAGTVEAAGAAFPRQLVRTLRPLLARLSNGALDTAVTDAPTEAGVVQVRLEALGDRAPRPVLVVAGPDALSQEAALLASHTGGLMMLMRRANRADAASRAYHRKAGQVRLAVFMALMAGDPVLARRMTAGAVPDLLDAGWLRVQLLRCHPEDRDRIVRDLQDAAGYHGPALMVRCPVYHDHVICLIAEGTQEQPDGPAAALRRLVEEHGHYALGVSDPHPLDGTADAYEQARHTLAVARRAPGRVAVSGGGVSLGRVLPTGPAVTWARDVLRPLGTVPKLTHEITRLSLSFPRSGVARLLGVSRNSVAAHLERAGQALDLDLGDVRSRATLALALSVPGYGYAYGYGGGEADARGEGDGRHGRGEGDGSGKGDGARTPVTRPVPDLDDLLRTPTAAAWARTFLAPLPNGPRDLRGTLGAWIDANTDARRASRDLGVGRNTVGDRLRTAGRLLHRDLLGTHSGVYDLVHAFTAEALAAEGLDPEEVTSEGATSEGLTAVAGAAGRQTDGPPQG